VNHYPFILKYQIFYHKSGSGNDLYSALNQKGIYYYGINETNFLNSFGIGFDAIVCDNVNKAQNKGKLSYIKEAFLGIKNYKPFDLEVEYNNERHSYKNVWLCSLQNGNYFGGGLKIAKDANPHDKEIDLCIAHDVGRFMVLIILLFVKLGKVHLFKKYFLSLKVSDLKIYLKEERLAQFDGNTLVLNNTQTLKNKGHIDLEKTNIN
ncbi:MAG: hypothetical protein RR577_05640, partial [Erysipelotrichales bacterium]